MSSIEKSFLIVLLSLTICILNCQAEDSKDPPRGPLGFLFFQGGSKTDFDKCLDESGLTKDDLKAFRPDETKEPSTQHLCLAKCLATANGLLGKDGVIASDILKKNVPPFIDEATINTAIKCVEAAGPITTCEDMSKILKCIPKPPKRPE